MADEPREPAIEVDAIRWERVQLIRSRPVCRPVSRSTCSRLDLVRRTRRWRGDAADTRDDRCRSAPRPGSTCWSVRAWSRSGPAGTLRTPSSRSRPCRPRPVPGSFTLTNGSYRMTPAVDAMARTLTIDVDVRRRGARPQARRRVTRIRRAAFRALVSARRAWSPGGTSRASCSPRVSSRRCRATSGRPRADGRTRPDRDADLTVMLKPGLTSAELPRPAGLARALAGADVILLDDSFPPLDWVRLAPGPDHPAVARRRARSRPSATAASAARRARTRSRGSTRTTTAAIVSSDFDVPFYAEAFGIPEDRVSRPASRGWTASSTRRRGARGWRRPARLPETAGRRTILFAPTYRGDTIRDASYASTCSTTRRSMPLAVEQRRGRHHQDAPVRARAGAHPGGVPRPPDRRLDPAGRRQRPAVRGRPPDHRLLVDRVRVLDPGPADAVLRLRPRRLHRRAATSTSRSNRSCPGRIVRTFAEMLDAIRRDDYEAAEGRRLRGAHFAHLDSGSTDRVIDQLILAR